MADRGTLLAFALGAALRGPSCGTDTRAEGLNAPCTRSSDCREDLTCTGGMCVSAGADSRSDAAGASHGGEAGAADARTADAGLDE